MNKRFILIFGLIVSLFLISVASGYCISLGDMFGGKSKEYKEMLEKKEQENQELIEEKKGIQNLLEELEEKNDALSRDYQKQAVDKNNLLEQIKALQKEKGSLSASKEEFEEINEQNTTLLDENEKYKKEVSSLSESLGKLKLHLKELAQDKVRLEGLLQAAQAKKGDTVGKATARLKIKITALQQNLQSLKREKVELTKKLKIAQKDVNILDKKKIKLQDQVDMLNSQLDDLENNYSELKKENREIEKQAREFPRKFADIARQNKRLLSQAADMHYNSGVFFVKNNEYKQAIQEFKKVLEAKPDHAYAHYNLGYIYAEHLVDRKKAIEYFKNYLTYASDAKDADWVRKYIFTWQTWYGKETTK